MAKVKDLKKNINDVLGDIIGAAYHWEQNSEKKIKAKTDKIIDEAIEVFDELIARVNAKKVENKKQHFNEISKDLEKHGRKLIDKLNALGA